MQRSLVLLELLIISVFNAGAQKTTIVVSALITVIAIKPPLLSIRDFFPFFWKRLTGLIYKETLERNEQI